MDRGRVRRGRLAVILEEEDNLDAEERARLHEALRASADELERGEVFPMEQVLAEL